jgi:hypothetical protein
LCDHLKKNSLNTQNKNSRYMKSGYFSVPLRACCGQPSNFHRLRPQIARVENITPIQEDHS